MTPSSSPYSHLSAADRLTIESMRVLKHSCRSIAAALGRSTSTISREVNRGSGQPFGYEARVGQRAADSCRRHAGLLSRKLGSDLSSPLWRTVLDGMRCRWSAEQIAGRLALMTPSDPAVPALRVSHETIYCAIYAMPRGSLRCELVSLLRKNHKARMPRARGQSRFTGLQGMTSIDLRPPEVAARIVPGHWEGDLIKGPMNRSSVGTLVERSSRFLMLVHLDSACAGDVLDGFSRRLTSVPPCLRKTMTYDQGSEMALHSTLAKRCRIDVFFCDPHSPWQRGSNENANGLLREFLPKGLDLSSVSHQELSSIELSLNSRPRKILGFKTPLEVFSQLKLDHIAGVALRS